MDPSNLPDKLIIQDKQNMYKNESFVSSSTEDILISSDKLVVHDKKNIDIKSVVASSFEVAAVSISEVEQVLYKEDIVKTAYDVPNHTESFNNNILNEFHEESEEITFVQASCDIQPILEPEVMSTSLFEDLSSDYSILNGPVNSWQEEKSRLIEKSFEPEPNLQEIKLLARTEGGLISDNARKKAWPLLVGVSSDSNVDETLVEKAIETHSYYQQVVMDVSRLLKRFPPGLNDRQQSDLQTKVTRLVVQVLQKHPQLHYYQGFHDVAITLILVLGPKLSLAVLSRLTEMHLQKFMGPSMEPVMHKLYNVLILIQRVEPQLYRHLMVSEVGTMFCLPWVITWFGHVLNDYDVIVRLYDYFLASPPTAPLYLAAAVVLYKKDVCLAAPSDLPSMHQILSQVSDDLPFESLLEKASKLAQEFPISNLKPEVDRMIQAEKAEEAERDKRRHQIKMARTARKLEQVPSPAWLQVALPFVYLQRPSRWLTLSVGVAVAAVLYSYLRPYDSPEW